ncbi:MAG TPA: metal-sensitive transcriptional regulator [Herpetosiphonaceae bacterium]
MSDDKQAILNRLKTIEGHVRGVQRMVEDDSYCVDILRQTLAVRRAIEKLETAVLDRHLNTCVTDAIRSADAEARDQAIAEILEIFAAARP